MTSTLGKKEEQKYYLLTVLSILEIYLLYYSFSCPLGTIIQVPLTCPHLLHLGSLWGFLDITPNFTFLLVDPRLGP